MKHKSVKEFGKSCHYCGKRRESHMFPQKINGEYMRLCKECWDSVSKQRVTGELKKE